MAEVASTYSILIESVKEASEDDGSEFVSFIPKAISIAEERLNRELDTLGVKFSSDVNTVSGTETITKPTGYTLPFMLYITDGSGVRSLLIKKTEEYLIDYWPDDSTTSYPKYYAEKDNTTIRLSPTPDSAYTITISYSKKLDSLSTSNETNYLTDFCQDALFYATMIAMSEFAKHWEVVNTWTERYTQALGGINNEGRRARVDNNSRADNPEGGLNTLSKNET